jgi:hypothetical protein
MAAFCFARSRLFEIARVLGRFDRVARFIENSNPRGDGAVSQLVASWRFLLSLSLCLAIFL